MEFIPHSTKQEEALFFSTPFCVVATGIQWGKTRIGATWMKLLMHQYTERDDNFIITSPTFPIISQSTLPPFLGIMEGLGVHDKKLNCFRMHNGGTCWFRTGTDPDSVVGIPKVRGILADEAGKYSLYFWENIQGRSDSKGAPIMIVTSPYSLNWLYKEIIKPKMRDPSARPDVTLIQAKSVENPYFNAERYHARKLTMDPRRFNMMYGGDWLKASGVVYDCFEEDLNICDPFELPAGTKFFGGIDWGYTEPFVFKVRAVTPSGQQYGVAEFYKSNLTTDDQATAVVQRCALYPIEHIYAGPDRPDSIEALNRALKKAKCKAVVIAAKNDVRLGIDRHYELLKTKRLKYFRGMNPHTLDEIESYHYPDPEDLGPDDNVKDAKPVQQNDHALDAERYLSVMLYTSVSKTKPHVPEETPAKNQPISHVERFQKLVKKRVGGGQTENWS